MNENYKKVIDRIKTAADNGNADSQYILAVMFDEVVEYRNKEEAFKYYTLAANNGVPEAQYKLGDIYYYNKDLIFVDKNLLLAFKYYKYAADNGYAPAQYKIGEIYEDGLRKYDPKTGKTIVVVAENNGAAFKYYKLAADNGISKAQIRVMEMCLNKANSKDFEKYYTLASNSEDEAIRFCAYDLSIRRKTFTKKKTLKK